MLGKAAGDEGPLLMKNHLPAGRLRLMIVLSYLAAPWGWLSSFPASDNYNVHTAKELWVETHIFEQKPQELIDQHRHKHNLHCDQRLLHRRSVQAHSSDAAGRTNKS